MGCLASKSKKIEVLETKYTENLTLSLKLCKNYFTPRQSKRRKSKRNSLREPLQPTPVEPVELEKGTQVLHKNTQEEVSYLKKIITSHFLFNSIPLSALKSLINDFQLYKFEESSVVFSQGSIGNYFYIVSAGAVEVIVNKKTKQIVRKDGCFGEVALLHNTVRTSSIKTIEPSEFWVLNRRSFQKAIKSISQVKLAENKAFIETVQFFKPLTDKQKNKILELLRVQDFKCGDLIFSEGDPGDIFYIVKEGLVSCTVNGNEIRRLGPGEYFGEQALLYTHERTATVTALTKLSVLSLGGEDIMEAYQGKLQSVIYKNSQRIAFEQNSIFKLLSSQQIESCLSYVSIASHEEKKVIFKENEQISEKIYFVMRGSVSTKSRIIKLFECIGDQALINNETEFKEDYVARTDTDLACITRKDIEKTIENFSDLIEMSKIIESLRQVYIFRLVSNENLKKLTGFLKEVEFNQQTFIFKQDCPGESLFIVKEGRVDIVKDGVLLRTVGKHDFFGERAVILSENRSASAIAKVPTKLWALSKEDFFKLINPEIQKYLKHKMNMQNDAVQLQDLNFVKIIGQGTFGKVYLVRDIKENVLYALKMIDRQKISELKIHEDLVNEREILLQLDHQMLMKLVKTFKDEGHIYFLCEYVEGKDLFDSIRAIKKVNSEVSRFYIGSCVLILEYLHERSIVYRDLKPENLMIEPDGYLKLIDLGTAKILKNRTFTKVGTPHYMAPEVILGKGYGLEVDYWSLGVILFEFIYIEMPYGDSENDPNEVYKQIISKKLKFPKKKRKCQKIIKKLLEKNPERRAKAEVIMKDKWFKGFDWNKLITKKVKPPYFPERQFVSFDADEEEINFTDAMVKLFPKNCGKEDGVPKGWDKDF